MIKYQFLKNFWWGAATSGPQSEGFHDKPHLSVMDFWFKQSPQEFYDGVGPFSASEFYTHYEQDIKMMKEIGMNSLRTSIQWTRLIDDFQTCSVNKKGKEFYDKLIDSLLDNGILPIMNLYHFDMPIELFDKNGGWLSKETVDLFVKYAKVAFDLFGDRVKYWAVINEPIVQPEAGYLYGFHYPKYVGHGPDAVQIIYNIALATSKTVDAFRQSKVGKNGGQISTILNLTPAYTPTDSPEDKAAAEFVDDFFNNSFLDAAVKGEFPAKLVEVLKKDKVLWKSTANEEQIIKDNVVDFLGVNYYHPKRVQSRKDALPKELTAQWMPDIYFQDYDWPQKRMNVSRGWEIYPKAIYDIAINIKNKYPNIPWYISENGMGVAGEESFMDKNGFVVDDYRIEFYEEHLSWLHKAISEGCKCIGYHVWTAFDCWSWNNAYKNRYGYISIDLKTQKRTIKKSGLWLKETAKNNGF
ncbi:MAG: glycoside hydrolase family 1 protein [Elusimicrobiota bacterium]|jgi:beta-glucosidase/6-phospho-beta-glucosidase/beta-galactosidase|nr:glycoside hydrolase family 1 protein [Elusimicrobiota bacterium]